jgi:hypothetical protein
MQDKQGSLFEFEAGAVNQYGYPIGGSDPTVHHIPDPRKLVRRSDPATSQAAATNIAVKLNRLESLFLKAMRSIGHAATAQEIADAAVPIDSEQGIRKAMAMRESVRKRAGEMARAKTTRDGQLVRPALIRVAGERRCRATCNLAKTYEAV